MNKTVILTEKPSVAKDFAKALSVPYNKEAGYYESDRYLVTNALGHLLEPLMPNEIEEKFKKWDLSDLPFVPNELTYKPVKATKKQLATIKNTTSGFDTLIVATDAGREGELIARLILDFCKVKIDDNVMRFWVRQASLHYRWGYLG